MLRRHARFWCDERAAIAPLYALALFGLVGIAGVGWDYGRLMAMDSELQNAADQAALAAATQLDGRAGAMDRAEDAAQDYLATAGSDWVNVTRMANDGDGRPITDLSFAFFESYDSATDTFGDGAEDDADAKVVMVTVNGREAFYALTPIVGAFSSGSISANAVAGLETAICEFPPMMICMPDSDFPDEDDEGIGVLMQPGSQVGSWLPGTFGYLDFGNGANFLKDLLGSNGNIHQCASSEGVDAQNGNIASAPDYLNTRFDIYRNNISCDSDSGDNCPAANTRKDFVRSETYVYETSSATPPARPSCQNDLQPTPGNSGNPKISVGSLQYVSGLASQGYTRDTCHYGSCENDKFGDGDWDRASYLAATGLNPPSDALTRYDIYKWERDNGQTSPVLANPGQSAGTSGPDSKGKYTHTWTNYCAYPEPIEEEPATSEKDRRVITVAAVDCSDEGTGQNGNKQFTVVRWVDMFLVEPSEQRSDKNTQAYQIYAEVIGPASKPDGGSAFQYYGRNKPVLLR